MKNSIWSENELNFLKKEINFILKDYKNRKRFFFQKILDFEHPFFIRHMVSFLQNHKRYFYCYSGIHSFFLDPYGNIFPCIMLSKKIGNAKANFDKVWTSYRAKEIRNFIKKKKCACWTPCETYNSLSCNLYVFLKNIWENRS